MSRQLWNLVTWLTIGLVGLTGCHPTQPFYAHDDGDLSHYLDRATQIEYPDVDTAHLADAEQSLAPLNVADPEFDQFWDLSLEQVISHAMQNSKVIRSVGAVTQFGVADGLLGRTAAANTIYDAALTESNTLGGPRPVDRSNGSVFLTELQTQATQQGVEDALSEFDAQFFSSVNYSTTDRPRNVLAGNPFNPVFFQQNSGQSLAAISKKTAGGGIYSFRNRNTYTYNNIPIGIGRALPSDWQTEFEVEAQYPLLRGRGEQVNRIPIVLARINTDISLSDFESSVRNLLMDIENTYWDLSLAFRAVETARIGRDSAQVVWRNTNAKKLGGVEGSQKEAQTREQYFFFRAQLETSQHELFEAEARLRWLMGLAASDGRVIRPTDEPTTAEVQFDWVEVRTESLIRSPELRQQKWRIKQRELELIAARNQLLPRLNTNLLYRWVGVGDDLINADRNGIDFPDEGSTAFDGLTEGNFQEAVLGLEFTPPQFGARRPLAGIRHAQLQVARSQAQLEDMELQQVHLLATAWRNVHHRYALAVSHFDRWAASQADVQSATVLHERGKENLDIVLDAQRRLAQSQLDFYRSLSDYNKSIAEVHFRKGSLMEFNGIELAEGQWPQKAYWDALGHARERDASYYLNYGWTRPNVVSQGPVEQGVDGDIDGEMIFGDPGLPADAIPSPSPTPADETDPTAPDEAPKAPSGSPSVTGGPAMPSLEAPAQAESPRSSRRSIDRTNDVVPASSEERVGSGRRANPLRQAVYQPPAQLR